MENEIEEKKLELVDLEKLKKNEKYGELFSVLIDVGLINEQGIRFSGVGMLNRKLKKLINLQDKTNLRLHFIEKKLEESLEK